MVNVQRVSMWTLSVLTALLKHSYNCSQWDWSLCCHHINTPSARNIQSSTASGSFPCNKMKRIILNYHLQHWLHDHREVRPWSTFIHTAIKIQKYTFYSDCQICEFWVGAIVSRFFKLKVHEKHKGLLNNSHAPIMWYLFWVSDRKVENIQLL